MYYGYLVCLIDDKETKNFKLIKWEKNREASKKDKWIKTKGFCTGRFDSKIPNNTVRLQKSLNCSLIKKP